MGVVFAPAASHDVFLPPNLNCGRCTVISHCLGILWNTCLLRFIQFCTTSTTPVKKWLETVTGFQIASVIRHNISSCMIHSLTVTQNHTHLCSRPHHMKRVLSKQAPLPSSHPYAKAMAEAASKGEPCRRNSSGYGALQLGNKDLFIRSIQNYTRIYLYLYLYLFIDCISVAQI